MRDFPAVSLTATTKDRTGSINEEPVWSKLSGDGRATSYLSLSPFPHHQTQKNEATKTRKV